MTSVSLLGIWLDLAVRGFFFAAGVLLVIVAMRNASAAARHLALVAGLLALIALPVFALTLPTWRVLPWAMVSKSPAGGAEIAVVDIERRVQTVPASSAAAVTPGVPIAKHAESMGEIERRETPAAGAGWLDWQGWVVCIWVAGVVVMITPSLLAIGSLRLLCRRAQRDADARLLSLTERCALDLNVGRPVSLLLSAHRTMPMTWGCLRPIILLPAEAEQWPDRKLRSALLHELSHVKRWDSLTNLAGQLARALHWFNPLVWWTVARLAREREQACDDLVIRTGLDASVYAQQLVQLASGTCVDSEGLPMATASSLEGRIVALLDAGRNRRAITRVQGIIVFVLPFSAAALVSVVHAQENGDPHPPPVAATESTSDRAEPRIEWSMTKNSPSQDNPLGLDDDLLVRLFELGRELHHTAGGCISFAQNEARLPRNISDLIAGHTKRIWQIDGGDPFAPGEKLRVVQDPDAADTVQFWSVGPDGKWDGGREIDSTQREWVGDIGVKIRPPKRRQTWLADETMAFYLDGKRLAHYLAAKGVKSEQPELLTGGPVHWGPVVDGLQLGFELPETRYRLRDSIVLDVHLRNTANYAIPVRVANFNLIAETSDGKRVGRVDTLPLVYPSLPTDREVLQPGEVSTYSGYVLIFMADGNPYQDPSGERRRIDGWAHTATPGDYVIGFKQSFPVFYGSKAHQWTGELVTGMVRVTIDPDAAE